MKRIFYAILLVVVLLSLPRAAEGRTLVVYYSFTNDTRTIVGQLTDQMEADVYEVQPAEEGLDYAANNYAIGSRLIAAIREAPEQASSYPSIKQNKVDLSQYDNIIIATPLWWSNMAAPMQTFLFEHGREMAGKHVALIVSSQSSGISSVVADARRLVPDAVWAGDALWINRSNRSRTASLLAEWLKEQTFAPDQMAENIVILVGNTAFPVTLEQNAAAEAFVALLPLTVEMPRRSISGRAWASMMAMASSVPVSQSIQMGIRFMPPPPRSARSAPPAHPRRRPGPRPVCRRRWGRDPPGRSSPPPWRPCSNRPRSRCARSSPSW